MVNRKVPVTITHRAHGIEPPLFVAGTFSDPQWIPHEMECAATSDGVNVFSQRLEIEPESKIQYKFRVGHGDWWMLDESSPTVTDDAGNKNNVLEAPSLQDTDPAHNDTAEGNTEHDANDHGQQLQPVPAIEALKQSDKVDRSGTSTPEYARTAAEVADSAAWVDPATPEPEVPDEVAAEVGYRQMDSTPPKEAADTAAEVADAAKALDTDVPEVPIESVPTPYRALLDVKDDSKDDSLDIAGYSNDPDRVPLFAHECAGLYEDDEIPGVEDAEEQSEDLTDGHDNAEEDFGDPTLERFPSTRDEIITTVKKVESGLNVDQTAFEGGPPSPVVRSRNPSIADVLGESQSPEESPKSTRGPRRLSLPRPTSRGSISERSASAVSLGSIAEGAEGDDIGQDVIEEEDVDEADAETSKADHIAPAAEHTEAPEADDIASAVEHAETPKADDIAPMIEHAEPSEADDIAPAAEHAEPSEADDIAPAAEHAEPSEADDIAPVVEHAEPREADDIAPAAEHAETPKADDIAPVVEHAETSRADDIAPAVEHAETAEEAIGVAKEAEGEIALAPTKPALRPVVTVPSPSVQPSNNLLSPLSDEDEAIVIKTGKDKEKSTETEQTGYLTPERAATPIPEEPGSPREPAPNVAAPVAEDDVNTVASTAETAEAEPLIPVPPSPRIVVSKAEDTPLEDLPQAASVSSEDGPQDTETPSSISGNTGTESVTETAATTASGVEDSQPSSLRKRTAPQPNPTDRAATPVINETGREAAKSGNWFTAFFRLIFVDWVGGFVSRLCGGKRKT